MRTLTASELKQKMEQNPDLLIVNVLGEDSYETEHIPGSHNISRGADGFLKHFEQLAGNKDREIVVYCASKDCQASPKATKELTEAGFTNVIDFEGGMAEWKLANYEVESGVPATR